MVHQATPLHCSPAGWAPPVPWLPTPAVRPCWHTEHGCRSQPLHHTAQHGANKQCQCTQVCHLGKSELADKHSQHGLRCAPWQSVNHIELPPLRQELNCTQHSMCRKLQHEQPRNMLVCATRPFPRQQRGPLTLVTCSSVSAGSCLCLRS
jgi:hypothetical protein